MLSCIREAGAIETCDVITNCIEGHEQCRCRIGYSVVQHTHCTNALFVQRMYPVYQCMIATVDVPSILYTNASLVQLMYPLYQFIIATVDVPSILYINASLLH